MLGLSGHQDMQNKHVALADSDANQQAQMIQPKPEDESACGEKGREYGVWSRINPKAVTAHIYEYNATIWAQI